MKVLFYVLPLLIITSCQGQNRKSKTKPVATKSQSQTQSQSSATILNVKIDGEVSVPYIQLSDKTKEDRVNERINNQKVTIASLKAKLTKEKKSEGLSSSSYKVNINSDNILSLTISTCYIGAHENCETAQFNFDLSTGYSFSFDQVIKSKYDIQKLLCNDAKKRLVDGKNKSKKELGQSWFEKDFSDNTYESQWQDEYKKLEYCGIQIENNYKLSKDGMTFFFDQMGFLPMSIRELMPNSDYFYPWSTLKPYLLTSSPISPLIK